MTVGELLVKLRRRLRDASSNPNDHLWSDDELIDEYANEARNRLFRKVRRLVTDSTTTTSSTGVYLCSVPIVAGTAKYAVNDYIMEIQRMQFTTIAYPLDERTVSWMDDNITNWKYDTNRGTPYIYIPDLDTGYITLYPIPIANLTLNITATTRPIAPLSAASLSATLGFLTEFHEDIIPGIMQLAYEKRDSQTDRPEQAAFYQKKFNDRLDELTLEMYRKEHGSNNVRLKWANMAK